MKGTLMLDENRRRLWVWWMMHPDREILPDYWTCVQHIESAISTLKAVTNEPKVVGYIPR
jgi:hypothetical protein